ncbi:hypothetical protein PAHAL_6G247600 [Panicum hallii]|uniref:Uncharacterized protein n=1 Tax=Panicum hallii TaxID=206008 RepID=A0A2T8IHH5_9POAL|nr:hypothetical protein PAHAL_6G247600 [Panicum hallii]
MTSAAKSETSDSENRTPEWGHGYMPGPAGCCSCVWHTVIMRPTRRRPALGSLESTAGSARLHGSSQQIVEEQTGIEEGNFL